MNPFEQLGRLHVANPKGVLCEGAFTCQECYTTVNEARHIEEAEILTWKCTNGHINRIPFK